MTEAEALGALRKSWANCKRQTKMSSALRVRAETQPTFKFTSKEVLGWAYYPALDEARPSPSPFFGRRP